MQTLVPGPHRRCRHGWLAPTIDVVNGESGFSDHFSGVAAQYAASRPGYPPELFDWLESLTSGHALAWDCGTGSGQTAVRLAEHFDRVVASDASEQQLAHAVRVSNVDYRCFAAEEADLLDDSVDLITVAQALHWFDLDRFYGEVRRVGRSSGVIAVWTYGRNFVDDAPEVTAIIENFHDEIVGPYWPAGREHVDSNYTDLPFPFERVDAPAFVMEAQWTLDDLLAYLGTWSSSARFAAATGSDPRELIAVPLAAAWGSPERKRRVVWPLTVLAGRIR